MEGNDMALIDYKPMMERCSNCSFCKWIPLDKIKSVRYAENCPSVTFRGWNANSARGRFQMGLAVVNGELEYTDKMAEITRECLACGACDVSCKICRYNLEPLEYAVALKADAVEKGCAIPEQKRAVENLAAEKTMLDGNKKAGRGLWAEGLPLVDAFREKADVIFFPGCRYSYDGSSPDAPARQALRGAIELLDKCGVKVGRLGEADACCAGRAWQMGFFAQFKVQAERNIEAIRKTGVGTVVTPCSDCRHALNRLYGPLGRDFDVLHISEYLEKLIAAGKISFTKKLDMTVTYHDPCHLGRQGEPYIPWEGREGKILNQVAVWNPARPRYNGAHGIYDAPRNIIKSIPGVRLAEMERIREYSWCCGAGGGCSDTAPEFSKWTAAERLDEAASTGADFLITACPWCKHNFDSAPGGVGTMDIIELALKAL